MLHQRSYELAANAHLVLAAFATHGGAHSGHHHTRPFHLQRRGSQQHHPAMRLNGELIGNSSCLVLCPAVPVRECCHTCVSAVTEFKGPSLSSLQPVG